VCAPLRDDASKAGALHDEMTLQKLVRILNNLGALLKARYEICRYTLAGV
jgi:hypothetical protein